MIKTSIFTRLPLQALAIGVFAMAVLIPTLFLIEGSGVPNNGSSSVLDVPFICTAGFFAVVIYSVMLKVSNGWIRPIINFNGIQNIAKRLLIVITLQLFVAYLTVAVFGFFTNKSPFSFNLAGLKLAYQLYPYLICFAFLEEACFRGIFLENARNRFSYPLISTFLFSVLHFDRSIYSLFFVFICGLVSYCIAVYTKELLTATIFHANWNYTWSQNGLPWLPLSEEGQLIRIAPNVGGPRFQLYFFSLLTLLTVVAFLLLLVSVSYRQWKPKFIEGWRR